MLGTGCTDEEAGGVAACCIADVVRSTGLGRADAEDFQTSLQRNFRIVRAQHRTRSKSGTAVDLTWDLNLDMDLGLDLCAVRTQALLGTKTTR